MTRWQRRARFFIGLFGGVFAVIVWWTLENRKPAPAPPVINRMDPGAVHESTRGDIKRVKGAREDVAISYEKELTYANGSSTLIGVRIVTTNRANGREFTVTGREGRAMDNPVRYLIDGEVRLEDDGGMTARTEHAVYTDADGMVSAPGPIRIVKGRLTGQGIGFTYDKNRDVAVILDHAVVHIAPDDKGGGAADISSGAATFARRERYIRFDRDVKLARTDQITEADSAVAHLSGDETRVESLELHGNARIVRPSPKAGGLRRLSGADMNLTYAPDGQTLEHAVIAGGAGMELAPQSGGAASAAGAASPPFSTTKPGRRIEAGTLDLELAPDGSPTMITGQDAVCLSVPAEAGVGPRTIRSETLDAKGEAGRGLTGARFRKNVEYQEGAASGAPCAPGAGGALAADRIARSAALDVRMQADTGAIAEAVFTGGARFEEQTLAAQAAVARYLPDKGHLDLSGTEPPPGMVTPRVVNEKIAVDAAAIGLTLTGPALKARGAVKSELKATRQEGTSTNTTAKSDSHADVRTPSILKSDQPTNVTADALDYDGAISKAVYTGRANLFQADTTIRADRIVVDDKTGDLAASGSKDRQVTTMVVLDHVNHETRATERVRSVGSANEFKYEDAARRATYTGDAHMSGPEGDIKAPRIELYLKPAGRELERAEAYEEVTLLESGRKTTGSHMTYLADLERYDVMGRPVTIHDECDRQTVGRAVSFEKATDTIVVDGRKQFRTQSKGGASCSGSRP